MAFPLTTTRNWVNGTVADPGWFNNLEAAVVGAYTGTNTLKSLYLDGVGNNPVTPNGAQLVVQQATLADVALSLFRDQGGNVRSLINHVGYPMGRYTSWGEPWDWNMSGVGAQVGTYLGQNRWKMYSSGSAAVASAPVTAGSATGGLVASGYPSCLVVVGFGSAPSSGNYSFITGQPMYSHAAASSLVCEFEAEANIGGTAGSVDWKIGLTGSAGVDPHGAPGVCAGSNTAEIGFGKRSSDTFVQAYVSAGSGSPTLAATSIPVSDNNLHQYLFELHGSSSPYGARARFAVDGVLVAEITSNLPTTATAYAPTIGTDCTGSGVTLDAIYVGPMRICFNRYLSLPAGF